MQRDVNVCSAVLWLCHSPGKGEWESDTCDTCDTWNERTELWRTHSVIMMCQYARARAHQLLALISAKCVFCIQTLQCSYWLWTWTHVRSTFHSSVRKEAWPCINAVSARLCIVKGQLSQSLSENEEWLTSNSVFVLLKGNEEVVYLPQPAWMEWYEMRQKSVENRRKPAKSLSFSLRFSSC